MIRLLSTASLAAFALAGLAHAETRTFEVGSFSNIDISAGLDLNFQSGTSQSVTVENAKGDFSDIEVEVRGDTLVLKRKKRMNWGQRRAQYGITVTAPVISGLEASSGSDVSGSGMSGENIRIDVSSGADVSVTGVNGGTVTIQTSSGSDASVSGSCATVRADSSSGSDLVARDLVCQNGEADASSGSDISIHVTGTVRADASSGGDVEVFGNPVDVTTDKSSGGSVTIRG